MVAGRLVQRQLSVRRDLYTLVMSGVCKQTLNRDLRCPFSRSVVLMGNLSLRRERRFVVIALKEGQVSLESVTVIFEVPRVTG